MEWVFGLSDHGKGGCRVGEAPSKWKTIGGLGRGEGGFVGVAKETLGKTKGGVDEGVG